MAKMIRNDIAVEALRSMFAYDPASGVVSWRIARPGRYPGARAGTVMTNGYIYIKIGGVHYLAHRIAWAIFYGEWPELKLDHRDRNRTNNRLDNLRLATNSQNNYNKAVQSNSGTGVKGVYKHYTSDGYYSHIGHQGKCHYVGYFSTIEEAKKARDEFAKRLHGQFMRS